METQRGALGWPRSQVLMAKMRPKSRLGPIWRFHPPPQGSVEKQNQQHMCIQEEVCTKVQVWRPGNQESRWCEQRERRRRPVSWLNTGTEQISPYPAFCAVQAPNRLDETYPRWGGQPTLLSWPRQSLISAGTPSRMHPDYCLTEYLGTVSPSQVDA